MKKIILVLTLVFLSGCLMEPYYGDHGHGYWHHDQNEWGHHRDWR